MDRVCPSATCLFESPGGEREIINVSVSQHPNPDAGMGGSAFYAAIQDNWTLR